uniref:Dihydrolipoamide acetyltransferase component of pyruvate dehydrogenase complex n=1 Tax=Rhabditophanes sp. KR3021 TaxID=114890 RepID=A0AC35U125_9BILA
MLSAFRRLQFISSSPFNKQYKNVHLSANLAAIVNFKLSDIGEGIAEVQIKEWYVKEGDKVAQFDNICDVQSDKASVTITSRYDGIIKKVYYNVDDMAKVGLTLVDIDTDEAIAEDVAQQKKSDSPLQSKDSSKSFAESNNEHIKSGKVLATPAVRRISFEHNIDLTKVSGTGKDNRVMKEDVLRFIGQVPALKTKDESKVENAPKKIVALAEDKIIPITGYTKAMVKSMSDSLKIPHFGYNDEFNVDELIKLRNELKEMSKDSGIKLTYMPLFIKACSLALLKYPSLNAHVDVNLENVIVKARHNICLAMDTPGGLVVPNIKNCDQKSIFEIAEDLNRLHVAGKKQQISRDDLTGGTFTLSNIGIIGGTYASPLVFAPQVAIGAIGKIQRLPRFDEYDEVYAANLVKVSWAADHRVVDGATMARFSNLMKNFIEKPSLMLANLK